MAILGPALAAALALLVTYLYLQLRYKRFHQFSYMPQLPSSLIWGHMLVYDKISKQSPKDSHTDFIFNTVYEKLGRPPIFMLDLRPMSKPVVVITNHDLAEQISRPTATFPVSLPKADTMKDIVHMLGPRSIVIAGGDDWKALRKRFNPGFAPSHLAKQLPSIVNKLNPLLSQLDSLARSGKAFDLETLMTNLTIDIIGGVAMDEELGAQTDTPVPFIAVFRELQATYTSSHQLTWWQKQTLTTKRRRLAAKLDGHLAALIRRKFNEPRDQGHGSVLALSLQGIDVLTDDVVLTTIDQLKSFFLAGHDTTSSTIDWAFYELSRTPRVQDAITAELDEVFGPDSDPASVCAQLSAPGGELLLRRLRYVTAMLREALRLHPPVATGRTTAPGTGFCVTDAEGKSYNIDNTVIYSCHSILHRDPAVYGASANDFRPERWLDEDGDRVPLSAWRPFERGPRNCIGQELAMLEERLIIAALARRYKFTKVGLGELTVNTQGQRVMDGQGRYKAVSELYNMLQITMKPVDSMRMKVSFN